MEHLDYKAHQTAAAYVANGLDEGDQEAFEMHLMGCFECVEDVEIWRAIKLGKPERRTDMRSLDPRPRFVWNEWPMAASLMGVGLMGAVGGWAIRATTTPDLDSTQTVVFNLPARSRGADECAVLRLASNTELALVRVSGAPRDAQLLALNAEQHELPISQYASRIQPDGSFMVRMNASLLDGRSVYLELRGSGDPLGCITGASSGLGK